MHTLQRWVIFISTLIVTSSCLSASVQRHQQNKEYLWEQEVLGDLAPTEVPSSPTPLLSSPDIMVHDVEIRFHGYPEPSEGYTHEMLRLEHGDFKSVICHDNDSEQAVFIKKTKSGNRFKVFEYFGWTTTARSSLDKEITCVTYHRATKSTNKIRFSISVITKDNANIYYLAKINGLGDASATVVANCMNSSYYQQHSDECLSSVYGMHKKTSFLQGVKDIPSGGVSIMGVRLDETSGHFNSIDIYLNQTPEFVRVEGSQ